MSRKLAIMAVASVAALGLAACGGSEPEPEPAASVDSPASALEAFGAMAGGGGKATGPMKDYVTGLNTIADAVTKVDNEASAKRAAGVIADVVRDMEKNKAVLEGMNDQQLAAAAMQNAGPMMESGAKISAAMLRLQNEKPELMQIISDELDKIPNL